VEVSHIASEYQIADIFTKTLGPQRHHHLVQLMGMRNSYDLKRGGFLVVMPLWRVPHNQDERLVYLYKIFPTSCSPSLKQTKHPGNDGRSLITSIYWLIIYAQSISSSSLLPCHSSLDHYRSTKTNLKSNNSTY
jgi:hypothetical protein